MDEASQLMAESFSDSAATLRRSADSLDRLVDQLGPIKGKTDSQRRFLLSCLRHTDRIRQAANSYDSLAAALSDCKFA